MMKGKAKGKMPPWLKKGAEGDDKGKGKMKGKGKPFPPKKSK